MISGQPGQRPDLLRQWELGTVPNEMADEEAREPTGDQSAKAGEERERSRWRWLRFWRGH